ncbi:MAG: site-specific integrase, partial [Euryarchaeota archaeon]|nr:site-specific integrase [Euryarchaeota archaeon]
MDQMDESLLENWFLKRDLSKSSRVLYHLVIGIYTEVTGLSLTELKEEAKQEEQEGIWIDDRKIQIHMLKFKKYLEETNRAPNTRCSYFNAVRSFYRS